MIDRDLTFEIALKFHFDSKLAIRENAFVANHFEQFRLISIDVFIELLLSVSGQIFVDVETRSQQICLDTGM